jgi:plasmid stabilization system protein ParE
LNIQYREGFLNEITSIWDFIALDSPSRATAFVSKIEQKIQNIPSLPYMYRKSIYFDDENIRDMIHQGYVLVCKIDIVSKRIVILGIKKYKQTIEELL